MRQYCGGDRSAMTMLVQRHQRAVFHFAMRHVRSPDVAQDVAQDAFVRVVQSAADFKEQARFLTWLFTIVRNLCLDHARRQTHRRHASLDAGRPGADHGGEGPTLGEQTRDTKADVERAAGSNELSLRIQGAVDRLPDEQREVFLLREVANLPFKEIAEVTKVSENTVKSRMRYALERLQEALLEYEDFARSLK
jgi:RNA polymerase sigma-70 factor (ECF subfamily)